MNFFIIVSGPTGVGKTDLVNDLIAQLPFLVEIINGDVGQMYTPLSIGTAKPDLSGEIKHHLFNILNEPLDYTVAQYRIAVLNVMADLWSRGVVPLIVGGSSFYIQSLFFPPPAPIGPIVLDSTYSQTMSNQELWNKLYDADPQRAGAIHPNDRYRVERALGIWQAGGVQPSQARAAFDPPGTCAFFYLMRDRRSSMRGSMSVSMPCLPLDGWKR